MRSGFCAGCKRSAYLPVDLYCNACEERYGEEND